jgi:hypothetical protein
MRGPPQQAKPAPAYKVAANPFGNDDSGTDDFLAAVGG